MQTAPFRGVSAKTCINDTSSAWHINLITVAMNTVYLMPALLVFLCLKGGKIMPRNQFQRMVFAFLTVVVTVHAYVFYSLYVVNGTTLISITNSDSVLHAIQAQGGVYMFGRMVPIWAVILIEFCFAYFFVTTLPAPITVLLPICTPGQITVFPPIQTLSPIVTSIPYSYAVLRISGCTGCPAV